MPVPDISRPAKIEGHMVRVAPTVTTVQTLLTCPADTIARIRSINIYNPSTTTNATNIRVEVFRGAAAVPVIGGLTVNLTTSIVAISGDDALYLEPGDVLRVQTGLANVTFTCFYELVT